MTIADDERRAQKNLRELVKAKRDQIAAENEAERAERNKRRWKAERDPVEYEKQKAAQREEYAAKIATEGGREVRSYEMVPGKTRAEHDANAKARDAARKRDERGKASQEKKDAEADRKWAARQRQKGWSEEQIQQGLDKRADDRRHRQPDPGPYESNPLYGAF